MSRKKTAIRITQAELDHEEMRRQARRDAAAERAAIFAHSASLMPSLAEVRAAREQLSARDVLATARSAARLEMRGANYSPDDRADCAAEIMRRLYLDTGGAAPRADSPKVTLTAFCGTARNLRDSLDRLRARDAADTQREAQERASSADGLDISTARAAADMARVSERGACAAVAAVLRRLGVTADEDDAVWLTLYQWVTGETTARMAERRDIGAKLVQKRVATGARFLREFFTVAELGALLALGARDGSPIRLVTADDSRSAHGRTPAMAVDPREGTDNGNRAQRPDSADGARAACKVSKLTRAERIHWRQWRQRRADRDAQTASALHALGRALAAGKGDANERASSAVSQVGRAALEG